jgi:dTDP-4-dehydrorhamnose 3,5-epimerase
MKSTDPGFIDFGETYFSMVEYGSTKAWKRHLRMTLNLIVPHGLIHFVFIDENGDLREDILGLDICYNRLTVPPMIWFGFKGLSSPYSLLMNIADIPHDPKESETLELGNIYFDWNLKK